MMADNQPVRVLKDGGCEVIRLRGDLDHGNAADIEREIVAVTRALDGVIVDLSAVTFLDSAGLRCLDRVLATFADRGAPVRVAVPKSGPVRFTLELTGFLPELMTETVAEAKITLTD
jgi:anti-sigma B factor antagonist